MFDKPTANVVVNYFCKIRNKCLILPGSVSWVRRSSVTSGNPRPEELAKHYQTIKRVVVCIIIICELSQ
jgi:hypothetical protein